MKRKKWRENVIENHSRGWASDPCLRGSDESKQSNLKSDQVGGAFRENGGESRWETSSGTGGETKEKGQLNISNG